MQHILHFIISFVKFFIQVTIFERDVFNLLVEELYKLSFIWLAGLNIVSDAQVRNIGQVFLSFFWKILIDIKDKSKLEILELLLLLNSSIFISAQNQTLGFCLQFVFFHQIQKMLDPRVMRFFISVFIIHAGVLKLVLIHANFEKLLFLNWDLFGA